MATTLNSRFVGVTAGLGTPRTLSWTGSRNTAPDTPTGVVTTEISSPAPKPTTACHQLNGSPPRFHVGTLSDHATGRRASLTTY
ncbi:hypothetical protein [Nonomuraea sp. NPDC049400]|uniref:hypothetical protein n=1 Tax=Nonomuraea sp. NPDC049400 TaxID=3364352 RepID=UPI0037A0CA0E